MPIQEGPHGKVELRLDGPVAELRFTDSEKRNCFSLGLTQDLLELTSQAVNRDGTKTLVITADGPVFCAGADRSLMESENESDRNEMLDQYNQAYELLRSHKIPVIVGAKGAAIGAGASLLCWIADLRIVSNDIEIWWAGGNYGLVPLELATYLKNEIGTPLALELLLLGKHRTLTAKEAKNSGLVNRVAPAETVDDVARDMADLIADLDANQNVSERLLAILRSAETEQIGDTLEEARRKQSIGQATTVRDSVDHIGGRVILSGGGESDRTGCGASSKRW
ncbi:enoyl-CoA hydratase/isomerase family protein [Halorussus marinus]|uniref:enoyl-CoA hydratase/isomerase family protein n=1 Tax=Halorussus marinus TaxID=2505976 RepID=UPI001092ECF3|nr:enoyl-CoA hydratase/isomerase family protein [Halorussus marinus]